MAGNENYKLHVIKNWKISSPKSNILGYLVDYFKVIKDIFFKNPLNINQKDGRIFTSGSEYICILFQHQYEIYKLNDFHYIKRFYVPLQIDLSNIKFNLSADAKITAINSVGNKIILLKNDYENFNIQKIDSLEIDIPINANEIQISLDDISNFYFIPTEINKYYLIVFDRVGNLITLSVNNHGKFPHVESVTGMNSLSNRTRCISNSFYCCDKNILIFTSSSSYNDAPAQACCLFNQYSISTLNIDIVKKKISSPFIQKTCILCQKRSSYTNHFSYLLPYKKYNINSVSILVYDELVISTYSNIFVLSMSYQTFKYIINISEVSLADACFFEAYGFDQTTLLIKLCDSSVITYDLTKHQPTTLFPSGQKIKQITKPMNKHFWFLHDVVNDNNNVSLVQYQNISDHEICMKKLLMGKIDEALLHAEKTHLNQDFIYKYIWKISNKTSDHLVLLSKIIDENWVLKECFTHFTTNISTLKCLLRHMLNLLLKSTRKDRTILYNFYIHLSKRIFLYEVILEIDENQLYRSSNFFDYICYGHCLEIAEYFCLNYNYKITSYILQIFYLELKQHYLPLLSLIPDTTAIEEYFSLLPFSISGIEKNSSIFNEKMPNFPLSDEFSNATNINIYKDDYINEFYSKYESLLTFTNASEQINLSNWCRFMSYKISDNSHLCNISLSFILYAISINIIGLDDLLLDFKIINEFIYINQYDINLQQFLRLDHTEKAQMFLYLICKNNITTTIHLFILFLLAVDIDERETIIFNSIKNNSNPFQYIIFFIENYKMCQLKTDFPIRLLHKHLKDKNYFNHLENEDFNKLIHNLSNHINIGSVTGKAAIRYNHLLSFQRLSTILRKLNITELDSLFAISKTNVVSTDVFTSIFRKIPINIFTSQSILIYELINSLEKLGNNNMNDFVKEFYKESLVNCISEDDVKCIFNFFDKLLYDFSYYKVDVSKIFYHAANTFFMRSEVYRDNYFNMAIVIIEHVENENDDLIKLKKRSVACNHLNKLNIMIPPKTVIFVSDINPLLQLVIRKFEYSQDNIASLLDIYKLVNYPNINDCCESFIYNEISCNLLEKEKFSDCLFLCNRLISKKSKKYWPTIKLLADRAVSLTLTSRINLIQFAIQNCESDNLIECLNILKRLNSEYYISNNICLGDVQSIPVLLCPDSQYKIYDYIQGNFFKLDDQNIICYLLSLEEIFISKIITNKQLNPNLIGHFCYASAVVSFLNKQIFVDPNDWIEISSIEPDCLTSICLSLHKNKESILKILHQLAHSLNLFQILEKIKPGLNINDFLWNEEYRNKYKISEIPGETSHLTKVNMSSQCSDLIEEYGTKLFTYYIKYKESQISDHFDEIVNSVLKEFYDIKISSRIFIYIIEKVSFNPKYLLDWFIYAGNYFGVNHILLGDNTINDHIRNIKRIKSLLPELNYLNFLNDDFSSLINSLTEKNIHSVTRLIVQLKISKKTLNKSIIYSLYIKKILLEQTKNDTNDFNEFLNHPNIFFTSYLWNDIEVCDLDSIFSSLCYTYKPYLEISTKSHYVISEYFEYVTKIRLNSGLSIGSSDELVTLEKKIKFSKTYFKYLSSILKPLNQNEITIIEKIKYFYWDPNFSFNTFLNNILTVESRDQFLLNITKWIAVHSSSQLQSMISHYIDEVFNNIYDINNLNPMKLEEIYWIFRNISKLQSLFDSENYIHLVSNVEATLIYVKNNHTNTIEIEDDMCQLFQYFFSSFNKSNSVLSYDYLYYIIKNHFELDPYISDSLAKLKDVSCPNTSEKKELLEYLLTLENSSIHICKLAGLLIIWGSDAKNVPMIFGANLIMKFLVSTIEKYSASQIVIDTWKVLNKYIMFEDVNVIRIYNCFWNNKLFIPALNWVFICENKECIKIALSDIENLRDQMVIQQILDNPYILESFLYFKCCGLLFNLHCDHLYKSLLAYCCRNKYYSTNSYSSSQTLLEELYTQLDDTGFVKERDRIQKSIYDGLLPYLI